MYLYMLTLCSGLSHYFPDAFSNKYVLPSVTELLKQRSLQHRSIAIALAHTGVRRARILFERTAESERDPVITTSKSAANGRSRRRRHGGLRRLRRRRRQRGWRRRRLRVYAVVTLEASSSPAENTGL